MGDPVRPRGEPRITGQLRPPEELRAQRRPLPFVLDREQHLLAVGGPERAVGRDGGVPGAQPRGLSAAVAGVVGGLAHPLRERLEERDLHGVGLAGRRPRVQRGEDAAVGVHPGGDVGDGDPDAGGLLGRPGERHQPRLALHQQVVRLAVGPWTAGAVPGDGAGDEPRQPPGQLGGAEPEPVGGARREVLDEDVGAFQEPVQDLPAPRVLQIQGEGLLGPVQPHEVAGLPVHGPVVAAGEVAVARAFHLDDARPEVGELPGGVGRSHRLLETDHRDPGQGKPLHARVSCRRAGRPPPGSAGRPCAQLSTAPSRPCQRPPRPHLRVRGRSRPARRSADEQPAQPVQPGGAGRPGEGGAGGETVEAVEPPGQTWSSATPPACQIRVA